MDVGSGALFGGRRLSRIECLDAKSGIEVGDAAWDRVQMQAAESVPRDPSQGPSVHDAESLLAAPGRCSPTRPERSTMKDCLSRSDFTIHSVQDLKRERATAGALDFAERQR